METKTETPVSEWKLRVLDLCQKGGVSMVEVSWMQGSKGERALYGGGSPDCNVVLWVGLTENLIQALVQLMAEEKIEARTANPLIYLADGGGLNLPIAKGINRKYKTPHWAPVVLNLSLASKILATLQDAPEGMSRQEIIAKASQSIPTKAQLEQAFLALARTGCACACTERRGRKEVEVWHAAGANP
jgi:hypothetical protein